MVQRRTPDPISDGVRHESNTRVFWAMSKINNFSTRHVSDDLHGHIPGDDGRTQLALSEAFRCLSSRCHPSGVAWHRFRARAFLPSRALRRGSLAAALDDSLEGEHSSCVLVPSSARTRGP